ncbi:SDR family oxidoreductase [Nannocystis radixulma]|uniref:SDR family oxidoreductase n=1 Tax=Nannocystis radixulma TaxID=2995305 RepID=A0ABT5AX04_9BACT|nr:SDR family oxidoreductase [Nannocystis radixulma]MDC0666372.1 SDR family oxidoreductase [Nannocystis radixulma]
MKASGKKCLITGAASGIGRATALAAAARGADLFLTDIDDAGLAAVVAAVQRAGGRVSAHAALDIADLAAVRRFADEVHAAHRSLDLVMNIAGISVWGPVEELEPAHWQRVVDVNLMGPIHVIQCFIPPMIAAGRGGHLVNVASAAALFGLPWHAAYSASKFGIRGLSEVLRFDLRRHGIGVSLVCPGAVDTPLVDSVQIVGVDTSRPDVVELRRLFRRHAVAPAAVAEAILRGVERDRYMVFTSLDIRVGHWFQQKFALPYEWVMRRLNDRLHRLRSR